MTIINTGITPTGIDLTCNKAYVANNNNYGVTGQDSVTVIDLCNNQVIKTIYDPSFNQPYTVTIHGDKAYISNSNSTTVTVICTKKDKVIDVIDGFDGPSGVAITCNGKYAYVNNYGGPGGVGSGNGTTVSVVDLKTKTIINTITTDLAPAALAINKKYLYVINYVDGNPGTGTMNIIKLKTNTIINTVTGFSGPFGIDLNDHVACVTNFGSNNFAPFGTTLSIVNLKSLKVKNVNVGIQPAGVVVDDKYAYVTNYNTLYAGPSYTNLTPGQGTVDVVDLCKRKVIKTIAVSQAPANIAMNDDYLYVTNFISNVVNVVKKC